MVTGPPVLVEAINMHVSPEFFFLPHHVTDGELAVIHSQLAGLFHDTGHRTHVIIVLGL